MVRRRTSVLIVAGVYGWGMDEIRATPETVCALLDQRAITVGAERDLHSAVADVFADAGLGARSEVALGPHERIDFLVGGVGVELKTQGSAVAAFSQLQRYAHHDQVSSLLLVTTRSDHASIPPVVGGKPCRVHVLRRAWLS